MMWKIFALLSIIVALTAQEWNASDRDSDMVLSNGNLTVSMSYSGYVRATVGKTSGTWGWEIKVDTLGSQAPVMGISALLGNNTNWLGTNTHSIGAHPYGSVTSNYRQGITENSSLTFGPAVAGDVYSFFMNCDSRSLKIYRQGVLVSTLALTGDMATASIYPAVGSASSSHVVTANFGSTAYAYPDLFSANAASSYIGVTPPAPPAAPTQLSVAVETLAVLNELYRIVCLATFTLGILWGQRTWSTIWRAISSKTLWGNS